MKFLLIFLLFFNLKGQAQFVINSYAFPSSIYDADADAFFAASGITDLTQKSAVNQLVIDLKAASIWTKYKAIYPMVGGTAALHKWNLKDPRDLDAAFRLTFSGGWTHSSTGAEPDGSTGYANTFLIPSTVLSLNSTSIQFYSTENASIAGNEIGGTNPTDNNVLGLIIKHTNTFSYGDIHTGNADFGNVVSDTRGLFTATRTASNATAFYKNSTSLATGTTAVVAASTMSIYLGAFNYKGTTISYSGRACAGAAIADGLTSGEVTSSYNAWQAFQTTLSRQQ